MVTEMLLIITYFLFIISASCTYYIVIVIAIRFLYYRQLKSGIWIHNFIYLTSTLPMATRRIKLIFRLCIHFQVNDLYKTVLVIRTHVIVFLQWQRILSWSDKAFIVSASMETYTWCTSKTDSLFAHVNVDVRSN